MRIVVVGAGGLVGGAFLRLAARGSLDVVAAPRSVDLLDEASLDRLAEGLASGDVVVCAAARPHVEGCELDPVHTRRIHVDGTAALGLRAAARRVPFVAFSTEYVFDGTLPRPAVEADTPAPLNEYGRQKLALEERLQDVPGALVARTSAVYGVEKARKNFVLQLVDAAAERPASRIVDRCRVCGNDALVPVLDLGDMPLANAFLDADAPTHAEPRFPLALLRCGTCSLGTLSVVVDPAIMFSHYVYVTGTSSTMKAHFQAEARMVRDRFLAPGDLAVEIGSNDGTLLLAIQDTQRVLGVEPAKNVSEMARAAGVPTETAFFSADVGVDVARRHGKARALFANNVVAHIDDLAGVCRGIDALLADDGVFVMEAPSAAEMLERVAFDTIDHEHLSSLSVTALARLAERFGLRVFDVEHLDVHLGSLRVFFDRGTRPVTHHVTEAIAREATSLSPMSWERFATRVHRALADLRALLEDEREEGRRVVGYGAPAKGNTRAARARGGRVAGRSLRRPAAGAEVPPVSTSTTSNDLPLLSIVVPVFNEEAAIERAEMGASPAARRCGCRSRTSTMKMAPGSTTTRAFTRRPSVYSPSAAARWTARPLRRKAMCDERDSRKNSVNSGSFNAAIQMTLSTCTA
jgi:novobiocin biosynthesis protein NovU/D-mycarose 3-C-methyltransferase